MKIHIGTIKFHSDHPVGSREWKRDWEAYLRRADLYEALVCLPVVVFVFVLLILHRYGLF